MVQVAHCTVDWMKKCMEDEVEVPGQEADQRKLERECGKRLSGT